MGDANRRGTFEERRALAEKMTKGLADEGKLIEAGWMGLRALALSPQATPLQINEMRMAFFAGAQHLWGSVMTVLDPGSEGTEADFRRLDLISKELNAFAKELELRVSPTEGSA